VLSGGTNIFSTTPETDPANTNTANKGVLEMNTDVDVFSFQTGNGPVFLTVYPWISPGGTLGGNLDLLLELRDGSGNVLLTNNPASQTTSVISTNLTLGTYYLYVKNTGVGDPISSTPDGYTSYGSIGQYFIGGWITATDAAMQLTVTANDSSWGSVNPTNAYYACGSSVQVQATPLPYCRFVNWTNDASGTSNAIMVVLNTNLNIKAIFGEIMTTNFPTPYGWLAAHGCTNNFETGVTNRGVNGIPLWQSYVAGLNPDNPNDQLRLSANSGIASGAVVLNWNSVSGRVYTVWSSTDAVGGFAKVSGGTDLPWTMQNFTNVINSSGPAVFYRLEVRKP